MTDFLNFLNTADLDTLTKIYGIPRPLAGNLIAARPFDAVEDCLNVRGMGKKWLAQLQSTFEVEKSMSENRAMITVDDEAGAPIERSQPKEEVPAREEGPSFFTKLGRALVSFLRALLRLIVLALFIAAIGAAFYYGLPFINNAVIIPIERNAADIDRMKDEIATLQAQLDETNGRVDALEKSIDAHTASLEKLDTMQKQLEEELKGNQDKTLLKLKQEVMYTRALDMLGRARLYLAQSNFGLTKTDVQSARDLLAELQAETKDATLVQGIERLDLALGNLPDFPVIAAGDLEIAWEILVTGKQANLPTSTPTPTLVPTSTPEAAETFTATPLPLSTATATTTP
jgi:hypothetical protein